MALKNNEKAWLIAIVLGVVLYFTNPSSLDHRRKCGLEGFTGGVVNVLAAISGGEIKYNNYILFSTLSGVSPDGESTTLSIGVLGFVKVFE